jgi:type II secretory pathway component PulF
MIRTSDASALTCPLADEALALSAVLKTTMHSIQVLRPAKKGPSYESIQQKKLRDFSQQLAQLHRVGSNLSDRWRNIEASNQGTTNLFQALRHEVCNLVTLVWVTIDSLNCYPDRIEQLYQAPQVTRVRQSIQNLLCLLEQTILGGRVGIMP